MEMHEADISATIAQVQLTKARVWVEFAKVMFLCVTSAGIIIAVTQL